MTHDEMSDFIQNDLIPKVIKTRDQAQKEYAEADNVFANFENVARFIGGDRDEAIMTYLIKHIQGLGSYTCKGVVAQREGVEGRIIDSIVYLFLLAASLEDKQRDLDSHYSSANDEIAF